MSDLPQDVLVGRAAEAARALSGVYSIDALDRLERDLDGRLGIRVDLIGRNVNAAPERQTESRWARLEATVPRQQTTDRLRASLRADRMLMHELGMGQRPDDAAAPAMRRNRS